MQDKIIQPSEEFERQYRDKLVNVVPHASPSKSIEIPAFDEQYGADKRALQQANVMLAEATLNELSDRNDLSDTPYIHSSTHGFGVWDLAIWRLFPNNRSQRILVVSFLVITVIVLVVKYGPNV